MQALGSELAAGGSQPAGEQFVFEEVIWIECGTLAAGDGARRGRGRKAVDDDGGRPRHRTGDGGTLDHGSTTDAGFLIPRSSLETRPSAS